MPTHYPSILKGQWRLNVSSFHHHHPFMCLYKPLLSVSQLIKAIQRKNDVRMSFGLFRMKFWIHGKSSPEPPNSLCIPISYFTFECASAYILLFQVCNVTQTSVTLEWPTPNLATAKICSLDITRWVFSTAFHEFLSLWFKLFNQTGFLARLSVLHTHSWVDTALGFIG